MGRVPPQSASRKQKPTNAEVGILRRDESARSHVYAAANPEEQTQRQIVTDLLERVFEGSAAKLVMQALAASDTSPRELEEIQKLIDTHRKGRR